MATKMKYKVVKNNTPTADKAPYTGQVMAAYELDYEDFVKGLVSESSPADAEMVGFFFAALYELVAEDMPANLNRYNVGSFTIEATISGSFPSEDAEFDEDRNAIVVGATLAQGILDAVGDIVPSRDAEASSTDVKLNTVMDIESQTYATIDGVKEFRLAGQKLFVSEADEYVRVKASDGTVTSCTVTKTDENGQRVYAKLPALLTTGTYTLEIASHGGDAANGLAIITRKVKVLGTAAGGGTPAPQPLSVTKVTSGKGESIVWVGHELTIEGTSLDGAVVTATNSMGEDVGTLTMTYSAGKLTGVATVSVMGTDMGSIKVANNGQEEFFSVTYEA